MDNQDILIAGAGLAGLSTAIEYVENGGRGRVRIVEAMNRPNELHPGKPGAGLASGSGGLGHAMMEAIGWKIPDDVIMARIKRATIRGPTASVEVDWGLGLRGQDVGIVTSKPKFTDWLLDRATRLGIEYHPGFRTQLYARHRPGWCALSDPTAPETAENHVKGDFLVGADGPMSLIADHFFQAPPYKPRDCFTASEVYLKLKSFPNDEVDITFIPSRISGYYWQFAANTNGDGLTKVGCGFTLRDGKNPSTETNWYRARMLETTRDEGYVSKPIRYVGGKISGSKPLPTVCQPKYGVAIAGEAGRMVLASIGAGDAMAIESGRALGAALAHGRPEDYQRYYRKRLYPYLRRHWRVKNALLGLSDDQIDRTVNLLASYEPASTNTRKEITRLMRWLILRDPFLIGRFALRALL